MLSKGQIAPQFAKKAGKELSEYLNSTELDDWTYGELIVTPAFELSDCFAGAPSHIFHLCAPAEDESEMNYYVSCNMYNPNASGQPKTPNKGCVSK